MAIWWRTFGLVLACLVLAPASARVAAAATTGQLYWCDTQTGFAMGGYDPVAYFVDRQPRLGTAEHEYVWSAVTWRFVSAANRAVFMRDPEVYAPQYGGYDAERVAAGSLIEGSPRNWLVFEDRLFFFATAERRDLWREGAKFRRRRADTNWPRLNRVLVRE